MVGSLLGVSLLGLPSRYPPVALLLPSGFLPVFLWGVGGFPLVVTLQISSSYPSVPFQFPSWGFPEGVSLWGFPSCGYPLDILRLPSCYPPVTLRFPTSFPRGGKGMGMGTGMLSLADILVTTGGMGMCSP